MNKLELLHQTILDFLSDLTVVFDKEDEQEDLKVLAFFYEFLTKEAIMQRITEKLLPYKKQIDKRDITFFDRNIKTIFGDLPIERIYHYRDEIIGGKRISTEHMNIIWTYLDTMIALAESYCK